MARFPSINKQGAFEAPEVRDHIKELVTGSTDGIRIDTSVGTRVFPDQITELKHKYIELGGDVDDLN